MITCIIKTGILERHYHIKIKQQQLSLENTESLSSHRV